MVTTKFYGTTPVISLLFLSVRYMHLIVSVKVIECQVEQPKILRLIFLKLNVNKHV